MKSIIRILFCFSFLLACAPLFAEGNKDINCPPVPLVASASFIQAKPSQLLSNLWALASNTFEDHQQKWTVLFGVVLPGAKTSQEAIEQGNVYFKTKAAFTTPEVAQQDAHVFCFYSPADETNYVIAAITPAIGASDSPELLGKMLTQKF